MGSVLGFDTSTSRLSVAVTRAGDVPAEAAADADKTGRPRHARELMGAIESAVAEVGGWAEVERIVVGAGPGTFTGLRIGIATANALGQGFGLPVAGRSSLAALAAGTPSEATLAVMDAKRNEVFASLYDASGNELAPPWVGPVAELVEKHSGVDGSVVCVGEGAVRFRDELQAAGWEVPADESASHLLQARFLCATSGGDEQDVIPIKPTYLRRPDAELWRERNG